MDSGCLLSPSSSPFIDGREESRLQRYATVDTNILGGTGRRGAPHCPPWMPPAWCASSEVVVGPRLMSSHVLPPCRGADLVGVAVRRMGRGRGLACTASLLLCSFAVAEMSAPAGMDGRLSHRERWRLGRCHKGVRRRRSTKLRSYSSGTENTALG